MIIRQAKQSDFGHLETFVWQAIFPAFDQPGLSAAQRAENDALVEAARGEVIAALERRDSAVLVAIDPRTRTLAGYLIADAAPGAYATLSTLIVKRSFWGKGVAAKLMQEATNFIGRDRAISLLVRHYNGRAIAFFLKEDFVNTGETTGDYAIPRTLMLREAYEVVDPPPAANEEPEKDDAWYNFPSADDEPVFEQLPDYRLAVDETPLFSTGSNALSTSVDEHTEPGETALTDQQLTELEAFIARARARKGTPAPREEQPPVYDAEPVPGSRRPQPEVVSGKSSTKPEPEPDPASGVQRAKPGARYNIPFEVDFGDGRVEASAAAPLVAEPKTTGPPPLNPVSSFEFAFGHEAEVAAGPLESGTVTESKVRAAEEKIVAPSAAAPETNTGKVTKACPDCTAELPLVARFCYNCGYPQPEDAFVYPSGEQAPEDDFLILEELPADVATAAKKTDVLNGESPGIAPLASADGLPSHTDQADFETDAGNDEIKSAPTETGGEPKARPGTSGRTYTSSELRQQFREHFQATVIDCFGERKLKAYYDRMESDTSFRQLRDGSLSNLLRWLNEGHPVAEASRRINDTLADLTEYFIVESAGDLSGNVLPQRLLRHQSVDWDTVDLFKLVMDYLDFGRESERVYTDFVTMPARALRNATRSFLRAGKDERIFLICDQSLISQAKNGFAVTDSGLYWKTVLQPAGIVLFKTLERIKLEQGHLKLDGQFFNAGASLNLKLALLLRKLGRM